MDPLGEHVLKPLSAFWIRETPSLRWAALAIFLVVAIALVDRATAVGMSFSLFYVVPLGIVIFAVSPAWGYVAALVCTGLWFGNSLLGGRKYESVFLMVWSLSMRLGNYLLIAFVLGRLRGLLLQARGQVAVLEAASAEKTLLLHELSHRVKNTLSSVAGFIDLESDLAADPRIEPAMRRLEGRVQSMAELYDLLSHSSRATTVNLSDYLGALVTRLGGSYAAKQRGIELRTDLEPVSMDAKRSISLGLVVNELVTDAFKYAFPGDRGGGIGVSLHRDGEQVRLRVADDGTGLPPGFDPSMAGGFGLRLVASLARELGGELEAKNDGGACFSFSFPVAASP